MSLHTQDNPWMKKAKGLTQALIISGTLNICLISTFAYVVLKDKQEALTLESKPASLDNKDTLATNVQLLRSYSLLPYQELLLCLENRELLEEGLAKRDLALSCLATFHHFNLEKALGGLNLQKRSVCFSHENQETLNFTVFPGITDTQFSAILHYAKTEKWPLTNQGLFYEIKRSQGEKDPSLLAAFALTSEYNAAYLLLTKSGLTLSQPQLVELLSQGEWSSLTQLASEQRLELDLSLDKRRAFLLSYLEKRSPAAAQLLIDNDLDFVTKRCSDAQILTLLDLQAEPHTKLEPFVKELLLSPRTEAVCRKAAHLLYAWAHEEFKEPYDHLAAVRRFRPEAIVHSAPTQKTVPVQQTQTLPAKTTPPKKKIHTIEPGDSLWKIARKYRVSVEELMKVNRMDSEKLRLGRQLEIPEKKA